MPVYHSPPSTPTTTASSPRFASRPKSPASPSATSTRKSSKDSDLTTKREIPYLFLGSIAAVTLVAHKYWPKGYPHGDKEDWELSGLALRARQRRQAEKAGYRGDGSGPRRVDAGSSGRMRSGVASNWEDGRRVGGYGFGMGPDEFDCCRDNRGWNWERDRPRRGSVVSSGPGRPLESYRDYRRETYIEPSYHGGVSRDRADRLLLDTERYYPSTPKHRYLFPEDASAIRSSSRYLIESSSRDAGIGAGWGGLGSSWKEYPYYGRRQSSEVVSHYREPPATAMPRRASFDAGRVRCYDDGYNWYCP